MVTEGISFTKFDEVDVIRHELVQRIIRSYKAHRGEKTTSLTLYIPPMFTDWLERRRLVRKGLACDKTRLSHSDDTLQSRADVSWKIRLFVLGIFIALLHIGVAWGRSASATQQQLLEDQILAFIIFISGLMLLELDCPDIWRSNSRLVLILGAIWFNLVMVKGLYLDWPAHDAAGMAQFYFLSPCTFAPFLITLLLGTRVGLFSVVQVSMLASLLIDRNFIFSADQSAVGIHRGLFYSKCPQARRFVKGRFCGGNA